ncbi:MAG: prepilin-type N-terminal cleavage/methylation domain-containing protein [Alphaproteobacteria bacterium]
MNKKNLKAFSLIEISVVLLIIGILITGITQSSRVVSEIRLASARSLTSSSPVASFKSLSLWLEPVLDSSFIATEAQDNTLVSTWFDSNPLVPSPSRISATQTNTSFQPRYFSKEINGLPALRFDGNSDWMTLGVILGLESASKISIFIVNKFAANNNLNYIIAKQDNQVDGKGWAVSVNSGNHSLAINGHQSTNYISVSSPVNHNSPYLTSLTYNGLLANTGMNMWVNGVKLTAPTRAGGPLTASPSPNGTEDLRIGSREDNSSGWYNGSIGEIIVFTDSLSDNDVNEVNTYLKKKWGIK